MDFTQDALASGRKFRPLSLMDGYTREALTIEADTSLSAGRVVRLLERRRQPAPDFSLVRRPQSCALRQPAAQPWIQARQHSPMRLCIHSLGPQWISGLAAHHSSLPCNSCPGS